MNLREEFAEFQEWLAVLREQRTEVQMLAKLDNLSVRKLALSDLKAIEGDLIALEQEYRLLESQLDALEKLIEPVDRGPAD